jgi:ribosomal-protein-alanine N-acetyltransferase
MRVRIAPWPRRPDITQLVLLDHHMVPGPEDVTGWLRDAAATGASTARTNALFPDAAEVFADAGFSTADTLALLELDVRGRQPVTTRTAAHRTRRLRQADLSAAAEVDRQAFGDAWSNDHDSLDAIRRATPYHRSRGVRQGDRLVGFAISGRAGMTGYIQRLAVDPRLRRQGIAQALLADSLAWMTRRSVVTVLVNTATDNEAALALYRSTGFRELDARLRIMEHPVST